MSTTIEWISVEDKKPPSLKRVLVYGLHDCGKTRQEIAQYIAPKTVLEEDFISDEFIGDDIGCTEYDEETDSYWGVEGWWEGSMIAESNWKITDRDIKVTHWACLPDGPEDSGNA